MLFVSGGSFLTSSARPPTIYYKRVTNPYSRALRLGHELRYILLFVG